MTDKQQIAKDIVIWTVSAGTSYAIGSAINQLIPVPQHILARIVRGIGRFGLVLVINNVIDKQLSEIYDEYFHKMQELIDQMNQ